MSETLERPASIRLTGRGASHIIVQNEGIRLSEEILLQLRRNGLRLIPQLRIES